MVGLPVSPGGGFVTASAGAVAVRPAVASDLEALGRCHLECWREAYGDLVDPARLAPFLADVDEFVGRWRRALEGPGGGGVRVAEDAGELVGFASVRPAAGNVPVHVQSLYVRRSHWSTGLGQRLLDTVLGDDPATLEVLRDNARARRFYARKASSPTAPNAPNPASAPSRSAWSAPLRPPDAAGPVPDRG